MLHRHHHHHHVTARRSNASPSWIVFTTVLIMLCCGPGKCHPSSYYQQRPAERMRLVSSHMTATDHTDTIAGGATADAADGTTPTVSPSAAPTHSAAPTMTTTKDHNNSTHVPTLTPMPTTISPAPSHKDDPSNHTTTTDVPSSSPSFSSSPTLTHTVSSAPTVFTTSKPTKKYTTSPTEAPHPSLAPTSQQERHHKHGILYNFSKFLFWVFMSIFAFLVFGKIMSHRTQIYFVLCQIWYKLRHYISSIWNRIQEGCSRLGLGGYIQGMGQVFARIGNWILGLVDRVRFRFARGGGRGAGMDDDGSTMMQGLLMRENV